MERLNYHHLRYFWLVAREGGLARASVLANLSPSTLSGQIRALERDLGQRLFEPAGRGRILTEVGRIVLRYAEEIFGLGRELEATLEDRPTGRDRLVTVGVADVLPKLVAQLVLEPALRPESGLRLVCREGNTDRLLAELAVHDLDVVLTESPPAPGATIRAFSHHLGASAIAIYGRADLARRCRPSFPASLDGMPMLLPAEGTVLRRALDQWLRAAGVVPRVVAEVQDSALLGVFGQRGAGLFAGPTVFDREIRRRYDVVRVADVPEVQERYYAVTVERRIRDPVVMAICDEARGILGAHGRTTRDGATRGRAAEA